MKSGRTLSQLAVEIERQATVKKDYIAPVRQDAAPGDGARQR